VVGCHARVRARAWIEYATMLLVELKALIWPMTRTTTPSFHLAHIMAHIAPTQRASTLSAKRLAGAPSIRLAG